VNLLQIRSAVPEVSAENQRKQTNKKLTEAVKTERSLEVAGWPYNVRSK